MAKLFERPLKPLHSEHPAKARRRVEAMKATDARAARRFAWASFVRRFQGPVRQAREALIIAMQNGQVPAPPPRKGKTMEELAPSIWSVHYWRARHENDATLTALRDRPKSGRPLVVLESRLEAIFLEEVMGGLTSKPAKLHERLVEKARELGIEPPSFAVVRARLADMPHAARVVAEHGRSAALADAVVHGAVPAPLPHMVWTLDELELPAWVKVYSHLLNTLVAVKASAVVIVDGCSGVVVGYFISNSLRRDALRGVDRWDVLAAIAGACFPAFAPPACAAFAGFLPRVVRIDKHASHEEARHKLVALGVEVPNLPGRQPWSRGEVERTVALLKGGCARFHGHESRFEVAEYADQSNSDALRIAAGTMARTRVKNVLTIDQLWNLDQLTAAFDAVVHDINTKRKHTGWKMPRGARYQEQLQASAVRPGTDALGLLEPTSVTVKKDGIVVSEQAFLPAATGVSYLKGEKVNLRLDPALRAVFVVEKNGTLELCRPKRDVAATTDPAAFAKAVRASVSVADEISKAMRRRYREQAVGAAGAEVADAVARKRLNLSALVTAVHRDERAATESATRRSRRAAKGSAPTAPATPRPVAGVVPISQAPSHGWPNGVPSNVPVVRRGISRSFS